MKLVNGDGLGALTTPTSHCLHADRLLTCVKLPIHIHSSSSKINRLVSNKGFNIHAHVYTVRNSLIVSSSSSLGSRCVPWLGEGLSMSSPNNPVLCCPLPYRVAPVFVQVVSPPLGWSPLTSFLVIWSPSGDARGPSVVFEAVDMPCPHSKNKWCSEGPYWVLHFVPNTGPYLVLQGTPIEGASKDPHGTVL